MRASLLALTAVFLATCSGCCEEPIPEPDIDLRIHRLDVVPARVAAQAGVPFTLSVRARNAAGQLLPASALSAVAWSVPAADVAHLSIAGSPGRSVLVKLAGVSATPIVVSATNGTVTGTAEVQPAAGPPAGKMDWLDGTAAPDEPPMFVLVDGRNPVEWRSDSLIAIVGRGPLDEFVTGPGEITIFSRSRRIAREYPSWTSDRCDFVRYSAAPVPAACLERGPFALANRPRVAITLWILADGDDIGAAADAELARATALLHEAAAGLEFSFQRKTRPAASLVLDVNEPTGWLCPTSGDYAVREQLLAAGIDETVLEASQLNVIYVEELRRPVESGGGTWAYPGYTCVWNDADGAIALVSARKRGPSTLAHELVHALGPWRDGTFGHTNGLPGFEESNLMWKSDALAPASRSQLTLGQAFRLSRDAGAFIVKASLVDATAVSPAHRGWMIPVPTWRRT